MAIRRRILALLVATLPLVAFAGPKGDFLLHCGGCHRPDGSGAPPEVPDMRNELGWIAESQAGRDYLVQVPGSSQAPLDDAELAAVVNWILTEFNADTLADDFKPLSEQEVAQARSRILMDPLKFREALWRAYSVD